MLSRLYRPPGPALPPELVGGGVEGGEVEEAGHGGQQLHHPAHDEVLVLARPLAQHTPETVQQVSNLGLDR